MSTLNQKDGKACATKGTAVCIGGKDLYCYRKVFLGTFIQLSYVVDNKQCYDKSYGNERQGRDKVCHVSKQHIHRIHEEVSNQSDNRYRFYRTHFITTSLICSTSCIRSKIEQQPFVAFCLVVVLQKLKTTYTRKEKCQSRSIGKGIKIGIPIKAATS